MTRYIGILIAWMFELSAALGDTRHGSTQSPATSSTQAALAEATRLDAIVDRLYDNGKYQDGIPLAERSLALRETARGPRHPDVAQSLNNLAMLYAAQGMYAKAEPLLARALDIRKQALGAMHPDVATSLVNLGDIYKKEAAHAKAEPLYLRALDIRKKALGAMHPDVAESLTKLAYIYQVQGTYAKAEPLLLRALDIMEKGKGAMHRDVGAVLVCLAYLYQAQGAYAKAEPLLLRALDIIEQVKGAMHPDVATSLNNLAALYMEQAEYMKAEPLFLRALAIREKALGPMHPDVAQGLDNLATLYDEQAEYAKAEPLLLRALDVHERALGPMHPDTVQCLNNLASHYGNQGAYAKAEPLFVRALDILEKTLSATHPLVAQGLSNLAGVYWAQGAYAKAEVLYLRALDIHKKAFGTMHPRVATSLNNIAVLYSEQGAHAKAENFLSQALDIEEKTLGTMHPSLAASLTNLATTYYEQADYEKAELLFLRALDIRERAQETMHPETAVLLHNLALLYQAQGAYPKAELFLARAEEIREAELHLELTRLSESRKQALVQMMMHESNSAVSLHADAMPSSPRALELALTTILRRKGRILDSFADNQRTLRAHLTPALRDQMDQLAQASTELSTRLRAPFDPRTAASRAAAISTLRTRVEDLESALHAASSEFRARSEPITIAKVQKTLPPGTALIEFVRYHRIALRQAHSRQEARYVAYILPWQGPPRWAALGEAAPIDASVDAVLAEMHKSASADATMAALQHLDALVFAPLRGQLAQITHVILSPDGKLNLVPFEALVDPHGHYELEQRLVSYVTSGRDLLRAAARQPPRSSATLVAAPDYGPPRSSPRDGLGAFRPLDGATAELAELPAYFVEARTLTGRRATKAALAAIIGPAVLHIATHGFYMRDSATALTPTPSTTSAGPRLATSPLPAFTPALDSSRGILVVSGELSASPAQPTSDDATDALDRAGLALAGANVGPDGIVSARELASYDWWGTQLVVLSACETGVGAVASGEGVYGMRRALVLAGTETQVVSLWSVSDTATRELMHAFYGELSRGTGRAEALRQAKLQMLRQPRFAHPYYWAAFIPAGDWTPLDPRILK
jgi:tetratricopeptide (TPR) repeat protein